MAPNPNYAPLNNVPYPYVQSFPDGLGVQGVRQPSLSHPLTIDPRLVFGGTEHPFQHNVSPSSLCIPEGGYYQQPSPVPSTSSFDHWVSYDELPAPTPSPISPTFGNMGATRPTLIDSCICGCGRGACIPQRDYDRQRTDPLTDDDLQEMILFRVKGQCGYHLGNALRKTYTGLEGRDDRVFIGFKSSISIRVEWLPYEKWTRQIRTLTWKRPPDNISRSKLATEVAKRMHVFFEEMRNKASDPSFAEYRSQPGVIDIEHLELVALKRVAKSSYMPHFRLVTPPPQTQAPPQSQ